MRSISTTSIITAPRSAVWAVLADFPNVADWNNGVKKSFSTSEASSGVGAQRHCDIAPAGQLSETIRQWEPDTMMAISIDSAKKMPITSALGTFTLKDHGDSTSVQLDFEYRPRFGLVGKLTGPLLDKQFAKSFDGYMTDLQAAVQATTPSH